MPQAYDYYSNSKYQPGTVLSVGFVWTRDYMRLKALMLENILKTHIMDARPIENFLQAPEPRRVTVFGLISTKFRNFSTSKKSILVVKVT